MHVEFWQTPLSTHPLRRMRKRWEGNIKIAVKMSWALPTV